MVGHAREKAARAGKNAMSWMVLQMIQAGRGEFVRVIVPDDRGLVHDGFYTVAILVVQIKSVANLVGCRAKVLASIAANGGVLVKVCEGAAITRGPHATHEACTLVAAAVFAEVIHNDTIEMIVGAGAPKDPEAARTFGGIHW